MCVFDDDDSGVIWKGDTLIDGVSQTLDLLRSKASSLSHSVSLSLILILIFVTLLQGKNIVFVTNNSMKSRRQYAEKFRSLGLTSVTQVCFLLLVLFGSRFMLFEFLLCVFIERMRYSLRRLRRLCTSKPTISPRTRRFVSSLLAYLLRCLSVVIFSFCRFM